MSGRFWAIISIIVVVFVGILLLGSKDDKSKSGDSNQSQTAPTNHVKGKTDSKVKLVEYGDFQCPTCGAYYPVLKQVFAQYQDRVAFQFRNLPLSQIHNHAFAAARAAEAASVQGKFWEMHDLLYENQTTWSPTSNPLDSFKQYARQLNLDSNKFDTDFAASDTNKAINNDIAAFKATKNDLATPTIFINGKKIELKDLVDNNQQPQASKLSALLDAALKEQQ